MAVNFDLNYLENYPDASYWNIVFLIPLIETNKMSGNKTMFEAFLNFGAKNAFYQMIPILQNFFFVKFVFSIHEYIKITYRRNDSKKKV